MNIVCSLVSEKKEPSVHAPEKKKYLPKAMVEARCIFFLFLNIGNMTITYHLKNALVRLDEYLFLPLLRGTRTPSSLWVREGGCVRQVRADAPYH